RRARPDSAYARRDRGGDQRRTGADRFRPQPQRDRRARAPIPARIRNSRPGAARQGGRERRPAKRRRAGNPVNLSAPFIRRPIATALLMGGLLLCGLVAYRLTLVSSLPNVNYPTIAVSAQLPGADPETMASS